MNPPSSSHSSDMSAAATLIEDAAIMWLTERDDGFSPAREREFAQWLRADARHAAAVARLEQTLGLLKELPEFRAELNTVFNRAASVVPFSTTQDGQAPARPARRWLRAHVLTGAAAAVMLGAVFGWRTFAQPAEVRYSTTPAGHELARLSDGSTLELNVASTARVQFTAGERRVKLENGEAHFEVAHDTTRPFIVSAGGIFVRAVGTAFNVRYTTNGAVEVIVTEGKVRIGQAGPESSAAPTAPLVVAGERIVSPIQSPVLVVEKLPPAALRQNLAWQSALAEFADAPLADIIARFNTRNQLQLVLDEPKLGTRRIGGTFNLNEVEAFVRLLERDGEIVVARRSESEILLRSAR